MHGTRSSLGTPALRTGELKVCKSAEGCGRAPKQGVAHQQSMNASPKKQEQGAIPAEGGLSWVELRLWLTTLGCCNRRCL